MSRRRLAGYAIAAVLILLFGGRWVALRYTEHVWFADLGEGGRHWRLLLRSAAWQLATFLLVTAWYAAHTLGVHRSIGSVQLPRRLANLEISEAVPRRVLRAIAIATAAALGLATTYAFSDLHTYAALYRHAVPLGITEPVLQRDAGFYVARLPFLEALHLLGTMSVLLAGLLVTGLYAATGSITLARRELRLTPHARAHLIALLGALGLLMALGFHLDALQIVAGGGHDGGALSVTDRTIRVPASTALAVVALVVAGGSVLGLRWVGPLAIFGLWATLGLTALLGRLVVPVVADIWGSGGDPGEQREVARWADDYARAGLDLAGLSVRELRASPPPGRESAALVARALAGVSPWSSEPGLLEASFAMTETERRVPQLWSVTHTVYRGLDGEPTLVTIGVPQTDELRANRQTPRLPWGELHRGELSWGGEPVAMVGSLHEGAPRRISGPDVPEASPFTLEPGRTNRIRFLAHATGIGIVSPDEATVGARSPGILLGNFARRLLLAWALQEPPLLDDKTSFADRVLYWRDLPARLSRLYPFAAFDAPRGIVVRGRLVWMADGYLVSGRFPLAPRVRWRQEDVNFLRAAYIATVDATTGDTRLYLRAPDLPFAAGVARAEGVVPLPSDSLGRELAAHVLYPAELLATQALMVARTASDTSGAAWAVASRDTTLRGRGSPRVTLALLALGPSETPLPWALVPLTDGAGDHLAGIVAGSARPDGSLHLVLLRATGDGLPTPAAAASRLAGVVPAGGDRAAPDAGFTRRGGVHVVPAAGSAVYLQVSFAAPERGGIRLQQVGVLAGGTVASGTGPASAAAALFGGDLPSDVGLSAAAMADARRAFVELDSARAAADWERFGRAWQALRRALGLGGSRP